MATGTEPQVDDRGDAPSGASPSARAALGAVRRRVLGGDRPLVAGFVASLGIAVLVLSGPVRTWAEERDLADQRARELEAVLAANAALEERVEDLNDPATIEGQAREEQGMYRPGEVPMVIVPPRVDAPQLDGEAPAPAGEVESPGLWERIRQAIADIFG